MSTHDSISTGTPRQVRSLKGIDDMAGGDLHSLRLGLVWAGVAHAHLNDDQLLEIIAHAYYRLQVAHGATDYAVPARAYTWHDWTRAFSELGAEARAVAVAGGES
jgi:hypothetical protein